MANKKLSVIVPVYNVEKYLDKCLNSLVKQTIDNYEIIVVNDGTKDNSQLIIDKYVEKYPTIVKSFIKENGGLGDARNYGSKYATGEYITFLDSDDYIEFVTYENMYNLAHNNEYDLVVADLEYFWDDESQKSYTKDGLNKVCDNDIHNLFFSPLFSWNKLYKRELFIDLNCKYPKGKWYEDIPVTLKFFSSIKSFGYYREKSYYYRQRKSSILGSDYSPKMYDIFDILEIVYKDFKERNKFNEFYSELEYITIEHLLIYGAFRFLRTEHYKEMMGRAFEFVKKEFPNYMNNKYIKILGRKNMLFFLLNNKKTMHFWHWYLTR